MTLYFMCESRWCDYYRQLIIVTPTFVSAGVYNRPELMCVCGATPLPVKVRGEVKS